MALEHCLNEVLDAPTVEKKEEVVSRLRLSTERVSIGKIDDDVVSRDILEREGLFAEVENGIVVGTDAVSAAGAEGEDDVLKDMTSLLTRFHVDEEGTVYSLSATSSVVNIKRRWRHSTTFSHPSYAAKDFLPWCFQLAASPPDLGTQPVHLTPLEQHLLDLYFTGQHLVFYLFSRTRFLRDRSRGGRPCFSPLLLSAILATGCHYSNLVNECQGHYYFGQVKQLLEGEAEKSRLTSSRERPLVSGWMK